MTKKDVKEIKDDKLVEKVKSDLVKEDDGEPSWYHYVIVLMIFASVFGVLYLGYYFFADESLGNNVVIDSNNSPVVLTKYPYVRGNVTYNLYFHNTIDEIEAMNFTNEVDKIDLLNTLSFVMAFDDYNGTDNGEVARGSTKLVSFFSLVYTFKFDNESFVKTTELNCSNSTFQKKVIMFNPYSDREGIFLNQTNGCIVFETQRAEDMVNLVDKLIYEVVQDE